MNIFVMIAMLPISPSLMVNDLMILAGLKVFRQRPAPVSSWKLTWVVVKIRIPFWVP